MPKHIQTQTEWEQTMARRVMEQLRGELYLDQRYLTAALGACTAMTIRWYADKHTWPLDHVSVDVQHGKKIRAGSGAVVDEFRVKMAITGGDLTPEQRQKLFEIAEECPVHKALTGNVAIIMNPQDGPAPA